MARKDRNAVNVKTLLAESADPRQATLQQILECEMDELLQARRGERTDERTSYRSGYYERNFITRIGKLELRVPQDRAGRFRTAVRTVPTQRKGAVRTAG